MGDYLTRLQFLAGNLQEGVNMYAEPKATHKVDSKSGTDSHANGHDIKDKAEMDMMHPKTSKKTGDKSGDGKKETGGKVVKDKNEMDQHHKKGGKGHTDEPKANHAVKVGGKVVKEWAEAIAESGDVEGTMRELLAALEEVGVKL
jgi:hypothetical protein